MLRMQSGRYRTEHLTRHWSKNYGFCSSFPCRDMEVTGDLKHFLLHCPAIGARRTVLFNFLIQKSVKWPFLVSLLKGLGTDEMMNFLLEPLSLKDVVDMCRADSRILNHIFYLCRTYVYTMHLAKQEALKMDH